MSSSDAWPQITLKSAGISLIDCDHRTPTAAEDGYPYIAIPQLKNGHISLEGVRLISHEDYLDWTKKLKPQANDVIVVRRCNSGDSAHVPPGLDCAIGQNLIVLRADGKLVLQEFLRWLINGPDWWEQVSKYINVGAVFDSLRCRDIPNFELTVPPIEHQREISIILGGIDDRIALLRETNTTLEAIAQALFKSWFMDFDPVRARQEGREPEGMDADTAALFPDSFEESELGLVPKGWSFLAIGEMVEGIYDGPHATPPEADNGPIFLGIKNLTGTGLDLTEVRHIHEEQWQQWTRRVTPRAGDIVFSYEATLGFFALIPPDVSCCLGRRLALIRPFANCGYGHFWLHQFISTPFQRHLDRHTIQGATVNRIALKQFPSYAVLVPPEMVRLAFDQAASALWSKIHANQAKAQTLTTLRDTLLPRLISGQLRLPDAEALVEEV